MDPDLTFVCLFAVGGMGLVIAVGMALQPRNLSEAEPPSADGGGEPPEAIHLRGRPFHRRGQRFGRRVAPVEGGRARHRHIEVEALLGILDGVDHSLKRGRHLPPLHEGQRLSLRDDGRIELG